MPEDSQRIVKLTLDERTVLRRSPDVEHERKVAIFDLLEGNHFDPADCPPGPYHLTLGIVENRLQLELCDTGDAPLTSIALPLLPFRRVVKEYFEICETYYAAIKTASPSRIEAIDMGRRGIHNEGSELLRERLAGKVEVDFNTARRLFTLICVLHIKG